MVGNDRRKTGRRRVCYAAQIALDSGEGPIEALVRSVSEKGAGVRTPEGQSLPESFPLAVDRSGIMRDARLVWRSGRDIGVCFDRPVPKAGAADHRRTNAIDARSWLGEMRRNLSRAN
ncbi:MAG: PilZ domain-containing protein [Roseiarcus sp.]|jgi:hypothetical protein